MEARQTSTTHFSEIITSVTHSAFSRFSDILKKNIACRRQEHKSLTPMLWENIFGNKLTVICKLGQALRFT